MADIGTQTHCARERTGLDKKLCVEELMSELSIQWTTVSEHQNTHLGKEINGTFIAI